jgi:hypothetical protein
MSTWFDTGSSTQLTWQIEHAAQKQHIRPAGPRHFGTAGMPSLDSAHDDESDRALADLRNPATKDPG